jgi:hypothetical protein
VAIRWEPFGDLIQWNVKTTINDSSPQSPTAQVTVTHTCYPAHIVQVNGKTVYSYTPPSNSIVFAGPCLYGVGMVQAATGQIVVPSH